MAGAEQMVAFCDPDQGHLATAQAQWEKRSGQRVARLCQDFREVLEMDEVDAVLIATPDHWHVPIAMEAIKHGKAVYVEKPLTLTIGEGRRLVETVNRYGGVLQVGSQQRSDAKFIRACELVRNGHVGQLQRVRVDIPTRSGNPKPWMPEPVPRELDYDLWLGPAPWAPYHHDRCHYNFRFVSDYSGGDVTNWGAHQLDIAQWGIGADASGPVKLEGRGKRNATGLHDVFYDINVDFEYDNGVVLQLRSEGNGVRFEGSDGWVYVSRKEIKTEPKNLATSRPQPDEIRLGQIAEGRTHMQIWLDAVRDGKSDGVNVTAEIGHRSATVCHLANLAMLLERPLRWDPKAEDFIDDAQASRLTDRVPREPWCF